MRRRNRVNELMRERAVVALSAIGAVLLAGCATEPAPVEDRSLGGTETAVAPVPARAAVEGVYRVVRGDTSCKSRVLTQDRGTRGLTCLHDATQPPARRPEGVRGGLGDA